LHSILSSASRVKTPTTRKGVLIEWNQIFNV
jgi:hypothetical protein